MRLKSHADWQSKSIDDILKNLSAVPEDVRTAVRNNGGGHYNHSMFWNIMKPQGGGEPTGKIADVIKELGGLAAFQEKFNDAGVKRFGSGWAWLVRTKAGKYEITSTANQDNPLSDGNYADHGQRCVGTRVLPEIPEPSRRISEGVVERGELGGDQQAESDNTPVS